MHDEFFSHTSNSHGPAYHCQQSNLEAWEFPGGLGGFSKVEVSEVSEVWERVLEVLGGLGG